MILRRIEAYVLLRAVLAILGALAIITAVIMLIDFVSETRDVGVRAEIGAAQVFGLTLLKSPSVILQLLPFVFLFGALAAFVDLNRRSELIAMRAAGVSAWRFVLPVAFAAFLVGVLTVVALNPGAAALNASYEQARQRMMSGYLQTGPQDLWLRQGDNHTQIVIRALQHDEPDGGVRLKGVSLFVYSKASNGALEFNRRIEAQEARLFPGYWRLTGAREARPGGQADSYNTLTIPSTLTGRAALDRVASTEAIPFWTLPTVIQRTEQAGFTATAYRLRFQQLLATPLLFAAMSILGAVFSLRLVRLGGLAGLAGAGVALGFVFFFFNQMCGALGKADILPAFAAAWTPPLLALLSGFTLLCYTEDG